MSFRYYPGVPALIGVLVFTFVPLPPAGTGVQPPAPAMEAGDEL